MTRTQRQAVQLIGTGLAVGLGGYLVYRVVKPGRAAAGQQVVPKSKMSALTATAQAACITASIAKGIPPEAAGPLCAVAVTGASAAVKAGAKYGAKGAKVGAKGVVKGAKATAGAAKKIGKVFGLGDVFIEGVDADLADYARSRMPRGRRSAPRGACCPSCDYGALLA